MITTSLMKKKKQDKNKNKNKEKKDTRLILWPTIHQE